MKNRKNSGIEIDKSNQTYCIFKHFAKFYLCVTRLLRIILYTGLCILYVLIHLQVYSMKFCAKGGVFALYWNNVYQIVHLNGDIQALTCLFAYGTSRVKCLLTILNVHEDYKYLHDGK